MSYSVVFSEIYDCSFNQSLAGFSRKLMVTFNFEGINQESGTNSWHSFVSFEIWAGVASFPISCLYFVKLFCSVASLDDTFLCQIHLFTRSNTTNEPSFF